jgi:hypothetical protein
MEVRPYTFSCHTNVDFTLAAGIGYPLLIVRYNRITSISHYFDYAKRQRIISTRK